MFSNCTSLKRIDLRHFDTHQVTNIAYKFSNGTGLTNLDLSSFDIRNVTDMERMFSECGNLITIFVAMNG